MPDASLSIEHTPQQLEALNAVTSWLEERRHGSAPQVFRLFGYAGTGKTTLARTLGAQTTPTLFAAYTGKAAQVLTTKGCRATTIHRLIYKPNGERVEYERDSEGIIKLDAEGKPIRKLGTKPQPAFVLDEASPLWHASLLIVDEVSMVNKSVGLDLLSFGRPILVLGDPAQLPPVEGGGFFTKAEPDYLLTEVHRQAEGSDVLRLATDIRNERSVPRMAGCEYRQAAKYDQVIVGTNRMRWALNNTLRERMGFPEGVPMPGDKIIILQNNYDLDVMNGESFTVDAYNPMTGWMSAIDDMGDVREMWCWEQGFTAKGEQEIKDMPYRDQVRKVFATFAWAITCHKSQGSQWGSVLVVDESHAFRSSRQRWLYTAVTRAADQVDIVYPTDLYRVRVRPRSRA